GIHCRVEDALDYDDRIYPRAASRLGPRHQANVMPWFGRPVEYVKPVELKKRNNQKGTREKAKKEAGDDADSVSADKVGKWVQEMPPGYITRGGNDTATLMFKISEADEDTERGSDRTVTR